ncbi:MAG: 16S rRNA (cytosine(967)-C(5))-methyltransferase RsmB [Rhodanobacteraceae bacterium]
MKAVRANDTRALAAEVLATVALHGTSLRECLHPAQAQLADPRDRALLTALCNEGARWWLRFDKALDDLLQQPLRQREPAVHALLVTGLVQLEILKIPPHAAVAATVEATRALGRGGFARLVNAVLRRWLRERDARNAQLDAKPETRSAHPRWLTAALTRDWPEHANAILSADNASTPPMLRINTRRATREEVMGDLAEIDIHAAAHPWLSDALTLDAHADVAHQPGFVQGKFSVQDGAAQCAADLLDLRDGLRVLDACAAPGGKTCHMLERANIEALALEREASRINSIRANLQRLGLQCEVRVGDAATPSEWWDGQPFDRILLDAPCSATGVIRRHPDIKLHRRDTDIIAVAREQSRLIQALWPTLAPGSRLVYATCSLLRAENEHVVAAFVTAQSDARSLPFELPVGHASGIGWQILPGEGGLDGMYYAVLEKAP